MADVVRAGDCYTTEILGVGTTAIGFSTGNYMISTTCAHANMVARYVMFTPETDAIRFKCNSPAKNPAAACGMVVATGDMLMLDTIQQIQNFRVINTTAGNSSTAVAFFYF